jgi:release factor glutamine methyltransferase
VIEISAILKDAKEKLKANGIDDREARLLLSYAMNIDSAELVKFTSINEETLEKFNDALDKRCNHVPFAYITGHKEFMKLDFVVNDSVLIPRPETEFLVQKAIDICEEKFKDNLNLNILDLCTGSGCVAISIKNGVPNANVFASDISEDALSVARQNAYLNNMYVSFIKSDLFESINKGLRFDVIVSNPPYIKSSEIDSLEIDVKDNEPLIALDGGEDGLNFYRTIANHAKSFLNKGGVLLFEIGFDEKGSVIEILKENGFKDIDSIKDYSQNDRVVFGTYV